MGVTLPDEVTLTGPMVNNFLARWRIRRGRDTYRLVLEGLVIPLSCDKIPAMSNTERELMEGPGAPVVILYTSEPITWLQVTQKLFFHARKKHSKFFPPLPADRDRHLGHRPASNPVAHQQDRPFHRAG